MFGIKRTGEMRIEMPGQGTATKRLTTEQVAETLRSLDESIQKLEKVVLHSDKSQKETLAKSEKSSQK